MTRDERRRELRRLENIKVQTGNWTSRTLPENIELDTELGWLCFNCWEKSDRVALLAKKQSGGVFALCNGCLDEMPVFGKEGRRT